MGFLDRVRAAATSFLASPALPIRGTGGWWPIIREPFTGAWQSNQEIAADSVLGNPHVFACTTLIASDIGKVRLRLVEQDAAGIWTEAQDPNYSPVLAKPNRYQLPNKFIEQWITSKLARGNTYVLKQRDSGGYVTALYILDPARVTPLVTPGGDVYYQLGRDDLSLIPDLDESTGRQVVVPASEVIHDLMVALFHPLIGVSPIFACGLSALAGLAIQSNQSRFFQNGSHPGGILLAPGAISDETAKRMKDYWETNFSGANAGKVAVLGDGLKYEPMTMTAVESQLIEQLKWTAETICSCFHVPPWMIQVGPQPPFANAEPMFQQYYSQCLQALFTALELSLDDGLGLPPNLGTEFDIDDLIWMDTATKTKAAEGGIGAGALAPNEARRKYYGLGAVVGGDTPYMQQQNFSLAALAERDQDKPFSKTAPAAPAVDSPEPSDSELAAAFQGKAWGNLYAG